MSAEGDVGFKSGFTIRAVRSPGSGGALQALEREGVAAVDPSEIWGGIRDKRIRALYLLGGDPQDRLSEAEREALGGLDFLVVQDILPNELTELADVVLPGAAFIEKDGHFTNFAGLAQPIRRGIDPPGDARIDWMIIQDVANALGGAFAYGSVEEITG